MPRIGGYSKINPWIHDTIFGEILKGMPERMSKKIPIFFERILRRFQKAISE